MNSNIDDEPQDLSRYQVNSRREIITLLRNIGERNQLVRMKPDNSADAAITSILEVDETDGTVIIDCTPSALANQRVLESDEISFDTVLDNIRIQFSASRVESCVFEDRPALRIALPKSLIRLQRREFYRVMTPVTSPVLCSIPVPDETGKNPVKVVLPLYNVSGSGVAVVDEKKLITPDFGITYRDCRIDLPGGTVAVTLRLRNAQEVKLSNGKDIRRLGFMFVDPPNSVGVAMQRYITKLERERNAKTGMS